MEREAIPLSDQRTRSATTMATMMVRDFLRMADNIRSDAKREDRLEKCECKACFYCSSGLAGAAMTSQPCGSCGKGQMYGSTRTCILCDECARDRGLCRRCTGKLEAP